MPSDDRINTPYIDLDKPEAQAEIAAFRIKRLEKTVDDQSKDISKTRETVVEVATTVKEMAADFKEIRTAVHPCVQTGAIAEIQSTQKQLLKSEDVGKSRRWTLIVSLLTLMVGLGATASSGFVRAGHIEAEVENEIETREKDITRIEKTIQTLPTNSALERLATKEDVRQIQVEVSNRAEDQGLWFESLPRSSKQRFCRELNEGAYQKLPPNARGGCREYR